MGESGDSRLFFSSAREVRELLAWSRLGMGFRENLVGSRPDDLRDALGRRVEFKVRNC